MKKGKQNKIQRIPIMIDVNSLAHTLSTKKSESEILTFLKELLKNGHSISLNFIDKNEKPKNFPSRPWDIAISCAKNGICANISEILLATEKKSASQNIQNQLKSLSELPLDLAQQELKNCTILLGQIDDKKQPIIAARVHIMVGLCLLYEGRKNADITNLKSSIEHYYKAKSLAEFNDDTYTAIISIQNATSCSLAMQQFDKGKTVDAVTELLNQSILSHDVKSDPVLWARSQITLGNTYNGKMHGHRAENIDEAIKCYRKALSKVSKNSCWEVWADANLNLGTSLREAQTGEKGQLQEEALACFRHCQEVWTQDRTPDSWAIVSVNLANVLVERLVGDRADNIERAIYHYKEALKHWTQDESPIRWAMISNNIAAAYSNRLEGNRANNFEDAISYYEKARSILTREDHPQRWALTTMSLANSYRQRIEGDKKSNLSRAEDELLSVLNIWTRENYAHGWAEVSNNLGAVLTEEPFSQDEGNLLRAIKYFLDAQQIWTKDLNPQGWARVVTNMATAKMHLGRLQGDLDEAEVDRLFIQARDVFSAQDAPNEHQVVIRGLANFHFLEMNWKKASEHAIDGIALSEDLLDDTVFTAAGRLNAVDQVARLHSIASYCFLKLKKWEQGIISCENGRARLLADTFDIGHSVISDLDPVSRAELRRLNEQIVSAREAFRRDEIDDNGERHLHDGPLIPTTAKTVQSPLALSLRDTALFAPYGSDQSLDALRSAWAEYLTFRRRQGLDRHKDRSSMSSVTSALPANGAMIMPIVTELGSAVIVLTSSEAEVDESNVIWLDDLTLNVLREIVESAGQQDGPRISDSQSERTDASLGTHHGRLAGPESRWGEWSDTYADWNQEVDHALARISVLLTQPVEQWLVNAGIEEGAELIFLAPGHLQLLPLHASHCVGGQTLSERWNVRYAPSAITLKACQKRKASREDQKGSFFVVSDPWNHGTKAQLHGASMEGRQLEHRFAQIAKAISGKSANLSAVLKNLPEKRYLHFACHGSFDPSHPSRSGLFLAAGERLSIGALTAFDQTYLQRCRLVFLSACSSGIGDVEQAPDEFQGLPAGFIQAGAPGVIATLWPVFDDAAYWLTRKFYELYLNDEGTELMSPAAALNKAQQWLRHVSFGELVDEAGTSDVLAKRLIPLRTNLRAAVQFTSPGTPAEPHTGEDSAEETQLTFGLDERPYEMTREWAAFYMIGL